MEQPLAGNYYGQRAARKLKSYFSLMFQQAGLVWNSDNSVEIDDLVDDIIRAVKDSIEADKSYDWRQR